MSKLLTSIAICSSAFLLSASALAAPPAGGRIASQGNIILSADRLFTPFALQTTSTSETVNNAEITSSTSTTTVGLFGTSLLGTATPYNTPRLGFDYTVIHGLTIGASAAFVNVSGSSETKSGGTTTTTDLPAVTGFMISPRVGYIFEFTGALGLWLRGGLTYYTAGTGDTDDSATRDVKTSYNGLAFDFDPQLVIMPVRHFGITVGFAADLPLTGSSTRTVVDRTNPTGVVTTETERDLKYTNIGLTAGLLGYFLAQGQERRNLPTTRLDNNCLLATNTSTRYNNFMAPNR